MANEITFTASLSAFKASVMNQAVGKSVTALQFTMNGNYHAENTILVASPSGTVIPLGAVTTPHWSYFKNLDPTNFVTIRNGSGGADVIKLLPGECAFVPLIDTGTFYAVANTANCLLEFLILSL